MPMKGFVFRKHAVLVGLMAALSLPAQAAPNLRFSGNAGIGYDANVANAESGGQIPATGFGTAELSGQYSRRMLGNAEAVLRGSLGGEQYFHYVGLSNAYAKGLLRLLYRPSGSFYAPTFAIWGSAAQFKYGSRMRDSAEYRGGAFVIEQLTTKIDARIGGQYSDRGADSRVFDLRGYSGNFDLDWALTSKLTSYLSYAYRYGDVFSSGQPTLKIVEAAIVIEPDDVFGGQAADEFAYRFKGHSNIGTLGFNYAFNPSLAIDLNATDINTRAAFGNHYNHPSGMLSLLVRF